MTASNPAASKQPAGTPRTGRPAAQAASAVVGPTQKTAPAWPARSTPCSAARSAKKRTALTLANTSASYASRQASAASAGAGSGGSSSLSIGCTTASAPTARRAATISSACWRGRVTSTRVPNSGRCSNQASFSRRLTTSPTTTTAGASSPAARTRTTSSLSGASTTRWLGSVPFMTTAAGVSGERPPASNRATIASRLRMPMRITRVSTAVPSASQRVSAVTGVGSL